MKTIEFGNEIFTIKNTHFDLIYGYNTISDAYSTASYLKHNIWAHWIHWFYTNKENENDWLAIRTRNSNMFTLNGIITVGGNRYKFYITKTKQELYPM